MKSTDLGTLEKRAGGPISRKEHEHVSDLLGSFPEKTNSYLGELMKSSEAVRKQFQVDVEQLLKFQGLEEKTPWKPFIETGIPGVEQAYDRTVLLEPLPPTQSCAAHCIFCIRKGYSTAMSDEDIVQARNYIQTRPEIKDVVITGGDPFVAHKRLLFVLDKLDDIQPLEEGHFSQLRIATRAPSYDPKRVNKKLVEKIASYGKNDPFRRFVGFAFHFNHPDEFTPEAESALEIFRNAGVGMYAQTTLLRGINDNGETLRSLGEKLRYNGVLWYYIYHNDNVEGTTYLRTTVQKGMDLMQQLGDSGFLTPHYVVLTKVGKARLGVDAHLIRSYEENGIPYVAIQTKYLWDDILRRNPRYVLPKGHYVEDDRIVARYVDGLVP